jgi:hypothetical protein
VPLAVNEIAAARPRGEMHEPDRLVGGAAAGPGNAGDRHREIGIGMAERAAHHRLGGLAAHRTVTLDRLIRHAEHLVLGRVGVGDETAVDHRRRSGDVGQRAGDEAAGARLRRRHHEILGLAEVEQGGRGSLGLPVGHHQNPVTKTRAGAPWRSPSRRCLPCGR